MGSALWLAVVVIALLTMTPKHLVRFVDQAIGFRNALAQLLLIGFNLARLLFATLRALPVV